MKHDVNLMLLGLLAFILMAMAVMAIYAQSEYKKLGDEYTSALKNLSDKNEELNNRSLELRHMEDQLMEREALLAEVVHDLNITKERQASLGGYYEDIKGVKETLQEDLTKTEEEKATFESQLNSKKKELEVCNKNAAIKDTQLTAEKNKNTQLYTIINDLSWKVNKSDAELATAKTQLAKILSEVSNTNNKISALENKVRDYDDTDISPAAENEIRDDLDDIQTYINDKVKAAISTLQSTLENIENRL